MFTNSPWAPWLLVATPYPYHTEKTAPLGPLFWSSPGVFHSTNLAKQERFADVSCSTHVAQGKDAMYLELEQRTLILRRPGRVLEYFCLVLFCKQIIFSLRSQRHLLPTHTRANLTHTRASFLVNTRLSSCPSLGRPTFPLFRLFSPQIPPIMPVFPAISRYFACSPLPGAGANNRGVNSCWLEKSLAKFTQIIFLFTFCCCWNLGF